MNPDEERERDEVLAAAVELLTHRYGGEIEVSSTEVLAGSGNALVLRVRIAPSALLPHRSVVVKHNPVTGFAIDDAALLREIVAYQFTTALPAQVRPGPVLLAHDLDRRIIVVSDVGDGDTLADTLASAGDEDRLRVLRSLGSALGKMHAGTAGREEDFQRLLGRMLRQHPEYAESQALRDESLQRSILVGAEVLRAAGLEPPENFVDLARNATSTLRSGALRAFTPFDLSPDNIVVSEGLHFLDYEWAGFRNVGMDVACVVAGFPQFVFSRTLSDVESAAFIDAWVRQVGGVWPRLADADYLHELVVASLVGWALSSVTTMYAGGIEGIVAMANGDGDLGADPSQSLLRSPHSGSFSEEELLVRRDLYETFESLARYADQCGGATCAPVAQFASEVARRLADPS